MSVFRRFFLLSFVLGTLSGTTACATEPGAQTPLDAFRAGQAAGDWKAMDAAATRMAEAGLIEEGMTQEALETLLGTPDTATGIYNPGGFSIGYHGTLDVLSMTDAESHSHYYSEPFWFHFCGRDYLGIQDPDVPEFFLCDWGDEDDSASGR